MCFLILPCSLNRSFLCLSSLCRASVWVIIAKSVILAATWTYLVAALLISGQHLYSILVTDIFQVGWSGDDGGSPACQIHVPFLLAANFFITLSHAINHLLPGKTTKVLAADFTTFRRAVITFCRKKNFRYLKRGNATLQPFTSNDRSFPCLT